MGSGPCLRGTLVEVILRRQVSPSFESPKAGRGFLKSPSVERYFTVCFWPTPHLSPGGFTPLRFGAAFVVRDQRAAQVHL